MVMNDRGKLGNFLKETIDWRWDEFCAAELDTNYKSYEASVFSLIRTAADGKLGAIKLAIDRVDGKIETPVKIEYPKVWILYPEATEVALEAGPEPTPQLPGPEVKVSEISTDVIEEPELETEESVSMSLRETLNRMADEPRVLTRLIKQRKSEIEALVKANQGKPLDDIEEMKHAPLVKSVIAANLLLLAEGGKFEAITEVFEQIDGKLVETIKILGDDIYLSSYILQAPYGAEKNKDGVYMLEATEVANRWKQKLKSN